MFSGKGRFSALPDSMESSANPYRAWFAWYSLTLTYVCIRKWDRMSAIGKGMWKSLRKGTSIYHGLNDPHTRMISA